MAQPPRSPAVPKRRTVSSERRSSQWGAAAAFAGLLVYGGAAILHPGTAPHETEAAFAHYADERNWGLIHLGELSGILLMTTACIALAWRLRRTAPLPAMLAGAAFVAFAAVYAVFIAVDGVALGIMVDRWAAAEPDRRDPLFEAAFAVRQIEAGLFGIQWTIFGIATGLFSAAFFASDAASAWRWGLGLLGAGSSLGAVLFGIVQTQTGFTPISMAFQAGLLPGVVWILCVGVFLMRSPPDVGEPMHR